MSLLNVLYNLKIGGMKSLTYCTYNRDFRVHAISDFCGHANPVVSKEDASASNIIQIRDVSVISAADKYKNRLYPHQLII